MEVIMSECGCDYDNDCPEAEELFERVKKLYDDARRHGYAEQHFKSYKAAMGLYRGHREKARAENRIESGKPAH
jgi:hypothetical protein